MSSIPGMTEVPEAEVVHDPVKGAFPGGIPTPLPDVPVSIVFLILFFLGGLLHISIYRANAKRGHKFLLSDLMFDFCMIRTLTCVFRIVWSWTAPRGVILVALIFENGGAAVIFAVNLFFAQRIFRAMHPKLGWHPLFSYFTLFLIWSVPAVIIINITTLSISLFSVGHESRMASAERALMFGSGWNIMLSIMPLLILLAAGAIPTMRNPERFGEGSLANKVALLAYASTTLAVGAAMRASAMANPAPSDTQSVIFGKALFYSTGFMLEILVVGLYALARIDLLYHVPNGSYRPGDYSASHKHPLKRSLALMRHDIEEKLAHLGIKYKTIITPISHDEKNEFVFAKLSIVKPTEAEDEEKQLPARSNRVSRRASLMEPIKALSLKEKALSLKESTKTPHIPESMTFYHEEE